MKPWIKVLKSLIKRRMRGRAAVPDEYHVYDLIWSIPKEYGGMTSAMLYRCWQFRRYGAGKTLTILTLQIGLDVRWAEKHIQKQWKIPKSVRVKNIWHDLREASNASLMGLSGHAPSDSLRLAERRADCKKIKPFLHELRDEEDKVIRREHLRKDGSLLVLMGGDDNPNATILYNSAGRPIKEWPNAQELYLAWLGWVIDHRPAVLINEHRNISKFLYRARMKDVKICQVVHGAHQKSKQAPFSELNSRAEMVRNLASFDLISLLSDWQKKDLEALGVESDNLHVIPNATKPATIPVTGPNLIRLPGKGVIVARLSSNKQVNHAFQALAKIKNSSSPELHIYGDGDQRASLEELCNRLSLNDKVAFKGHVPGVQDALDNYSFLLFTSQAEGQGLVLLEAMAKGCIPISYDMRYGPRSVITHGVDGFLVPPNDIEALTSNIQYFLDMPEEDKIAMRRAAIKRAECYHPENIMRRWRSILNQVMQQPLRQPIKYGKKLTAIADHVDVEDNHCTVVGRIVGQHEDMTLPAKVVVCTRKKASFLKLKTKWEVLSRRERRFTVSFDLTHIPLRMVDYLDFYIQPIGALWADKKRMAHALADSSVPCPGGRIYATKYGNISMDFRKDG